MIMRLELSNSNKKLRHLFFYYMRMTIDVKVIHYAYASLYGTVCLNGVLRRWLKLRTSAGNNCRSSGINDWWVHPIQLIMYNT